MNKKMILWIVILIAAFGALWFLLGPGRSGGTDTPSAQGQPVAAPETGAQAAENVEELPEGETDEDYWNYEDFPDDYAFRNNKLLNEHYEKHGIEMGFASAEEYAESANLVIHHPDVLWKTEKDDGDFVFFLEETGEFVVLSKDGYIRTYFWPDSGKKYYDKQ